MGINYKELGRNIKKRRKECNLTQEMLGELAKIEPSNISHIERATTKVSLQSLISIANVLEVSLDELIYHDLKKSSHIIIEIINKALEDCDDNELRLLSDFIISTKEIIRKNHLL